MEYLLIHRGGRGQSYVYELLYQGEGEHGEPFLMGLIDVDALRKQGYDENRSGQNECRSAPGQGLVRAVKMAAKPVMTRGWMILGMKRRKKYCSDPTKEMDRTSDPIGLDGGLNTFAYVSSNPVNKFDFYGLAEICNVGVPFSVGVPHTFLCANGQCGGKHSGGSGPALYSPTSQIKNDLPDKPEASCSDIPEKDCDPVSFDACVTQKLQARRLNEPYFFAGQNWSYN